jgi:CASP C terminal
MNDHARAYAGSVVASTKYTFRAPTNRPSSPTSSIIGSREDVFPGARTPESNILPIITQQRDRFRARNSELEEDLRKQLTVISSLRGEISTLQKDNLSLYEKVRYLQQFAKSAAANGDVNYLEEGQGASGSSRPGIGIERYRSAYEESITPFEAFRGKVVCTTKELSVGICSGLSKSQPPGESCIYFDKGSLGKPIFTECILCVLHGIASSCDLRVVLVGYGRGISSHIMN